MLRRLPLRLGSAKGLLDGEGPLARGWLAGLEEAAHVLEGLAPGALRRGAAFGVRWPYLVGDGWAVAPGIPVAAGSEPVEGPDGIYSLEASGILREAVGARALCLELGPPHGPAHAPDLIWFGLTERYVLRGGVLEVEDLFSRATGPIDAAALSELLVRRGRFPKELAAGLPVSDFSGPGSVEIRRALDLVPKSWKDPAELLSRREGVRAAHPAGDIVVLELEDGARVEATVTQTAAGWSVEILRGSFAWRTIVAEASEEVLCYRVVPRPGLDPLDVGVRTRIAFDLLSDLILLTE